MPSKGVQVFAYIAVPDCKIELSVPGETVTFSEQRKFWSRSLEVESSKIRSLLDKRGRFTFKIFHKGTQLTEQWIDVNALTGNASGGTLEKISKTPSLVVRDRGLIISYGLYEAGKGHKASEIHVLPNKHQCYITISPDYASWIGRLAPVGSPAENKPFHRLVLPAAHDVGMNSMESTEALLKKVGGAIVSTLIGDRLPKQREAISQLANTLSKDAISKIAPNIVYSLAITQKDSLETMLRIGARYFEFRPARLHRAVISCGALPDKLYFQHGAIPGMAYDEFLKGVLAFLRANPTEIVVVQLRWDGVPDECARPSDKEKKEYLEKALKDPAGGNGEIVAGGLDDMKKKSIAQLRKDKKRLIMLDMVDSLSTYTDEGNATLNGDSMVQALPKVLTPENQKGKAFVNIQCQATASNIPKAVVHSIIEASVTNSLLLATKGICDSKMLPWCRDNVLQVCLLDILVVIMNDWIDGATAHVCFELSKQRLQK
ncbi:uncharacterized protein CTHT_0055630 [Thermochaetoides thermophila DSM 1495]|uniref:PLC-like phosphodiesterase n=1 Tax=Chaetomium thermophilum (strain DSM 1495 / CBS 144.50 / IMI 039719) TaxID=759272 RepID=G0SC23_CHATD|nr:hypothetical protein CTHT_0055630 [Thermochaetoides thermophila DSM 1495]EGS18949.1 hypothetical protein CTHT_0055630 [Thermochaetoides thermophila DSM 1495]